MSYDIDLGGTDIHCNSILVGATTPGAAGTDITSSITEATVNTTTLNATSANIGASGTAGTLKVFPTTASKGDLKIVATSNTNNVETTVTNAAQVAARTYTIPDAAAAANFVLSTGTSTATTATSTELNTISGVTAGTVIASKALVADSGIKISGLLNSTFGAGTATVAPINLTSGTNLTTAAAGALEYDGTCFYATAVGSSRQNIAAAQRIVLTSTHDLVDTTIASATPFFVATGAATGAVSLAAGTAYEFEGLMLWTNTGTTSHTWSVLFGGAATLTRIAYVAQATTSTGAALTAVSQIPSAAATAVVITGASTSATENVSVWVKGIVTINGAGTFIPQILASARPGASGTPGVTALAGSNFRIWPIGAAANIVVGNWS